LAVNHVGKEGQDGGLMEAPEEQLVGIEVTATPNSNAHGQPWFEYPRQVYKFPLLHFQNVANIFCSRAWPWVEWGYNNYNFGCRFATLTCIGR